MCLDATELTFVLIESFIKDELQLQQVYRLNNMSTYLNYGAVSADPCSFVMSPPPPSLVAR